MILQVDFHPFKVEYRVTCPNEQVEVYSVVQCSLRFHIPHSVPFLVAPPLRSGATYLVTTASVCMSVCMYGCSLVEIFFTKGIFFDSRFGMT